MPQIAADYSSLSRLQPDGSTEIDMALEGVSCGGCISRIEQGLKTVAGVRDARVNFTTKRLTVRWDQAALSTDEIVRFLRKLGYGAHPLASSHGEALQDKETKQLLKYLGVAGFAAMNIMLLSVSVWSGNVTDITPETRDFFHWLSALIALPVVAYAGQPFFKSAWGALRTRSVNMDVPISLGVILAVGMSVVETWQHATHAYFDSAVMLLFFLLCGRYLDRAMRQRTVAAASNLAAFRAHSALRLDGADLMTEVPAQALRAGDRIVVRPGDRIAADGSVVSGSSEIDDSLITGETRLRHVASGDTVYAGSVNFSGNLTILVTADAGGTLLDGIQKLLDNALKSKSRSVQLADRAARFYAPVVHTAALLTLAGWLLAGATVHVSIITAISVLIITCPCALALAIPTVQVVTAGRFFRNGILLNTGTAIERLAEVDTVVFDKTGTLTNPEPRVANAADIAAPVLEMAARLGLTSRHPLAAAVGREAKVASPFQQAREIPGSGVVAIVDGVEAKLGSPTFCNVSVDARVASLPDASFIAFRRGDESAILAVHQSLRSDAIAAIARLQKRGLRIHIMSGDRREAVAPIATALGVDSWQAGLLPQQKVAAIAEMKRQGSRVLMVGDGLNDAPSLAAAHVSMSPVTAAELTQCQADAVFIGSQLQPVVFALATARQARRLMLQNLWLAVIYNAIAVPLAMAGLVTPLIAAAAMSGSSILVTLNAIRIRWSNPASLAKVSAPRPRTELVVAT